VNNNITKFKSTCRARAPSI